MTQHTSNHSETPGVTPLAACAAISAIAASLIAAGFSPFAAPVAVQAGTAALAWVAVALASSEIRPLRTLLITFGAGSAGIALAGLLGAPPVVQVVAMLVWMCCSKRLSGVQVTLPTAAIVVPFLVLLLSSLRRSLPLGAVDAPVHGLVNWLAGVLKSSDDLPACNSGVVYGVPAGTVAWIAVMAIPARPIFQAAGVSLVVAALVLGRMNESVWPAFFATLFVPVAMTAWSFTATVRRLENATLARWGSAVPAAASVSAVALAFFTSQSSAPTGAPRVVGLIGACHGSFELEPRSTDPKFNPNVSPPRFGAFRDQLERQGLATRYIESPDSKAIDGCDAFVTINFSGPNAGSFVEPVRRRVAAGARLLVLADHTDLFDQCAPTHALVDGTGIRLAFDSAVPAGAGEGWAGALEGGRDPLFGPHSNGYGMSWSVGCSLEVSAPARVLARATNGFADLGNRKKAGGLGTLAREHGEVLGGFALAADAPLGAGRILVFGDTSALQDVAMEEENDFSRRVGAWLAGVETQMPDLDSTWITAFALLLALGAGLTAMRYSTNLVLAACTAVVAVGDSVVVARSAAAGLLKETPAKTLWIDANSLPGFELHGDGKSRVGPLVTEGRRAGYLVRLQTKPGPMSSEDMLVLCEPARSLSAARTREILAMVESGGRLLICVGPQGARAAKPLLDDLGLTVGIPLGAGQMSSSFEASHAQDESNIRLHCGYELQGRGITSATSLGRIFGRPVALLGHRGKGAWCVVSDPQFPLAKQSDFLRGATLQGAYTFYRIMDAILNPITPDGASTSKTPVSPDLSGGTIR